VLQLEIFPKSRSGRQNALTASMTNKAENQDNALPAALIAQAEAAIVGNTEQFAPSRRPSRASHRGNHGGESSR